MREPGAQPLRRGTRRRPSADAEPLRTTPSVLVARTWHDERFATGVATFAREARWQVCFLDRRGGVSWFRRERFDGIITIADGTLHQELIEEAAANGIAVVNGIDVPLKGAPARLTRVVQDDSGIGRSGARHLIERGHHDLAYFNAHQLNHVTPLRAQAFAQEARRAGCRVHTLAGNLLGERSWLADAIAKLPSPLAVLCENDDVAAMLCSACREQGILVPEQVALLGVEDDPLLCTFNDPPLASISGNQFELGWQSAMHLDLLLRGKPPPPRAVLVPPGGVSPRRSSERVVVGHGGVSAALTRIRNRWHEPAGVETLLDGLPMSRSALYRAFTRYVGHPPAEELLRWRLDRVRDLLTTTDLPLERIAEQAGLGDAARLCRVFRRREGITPGDYRRARRQGG